MEQTPNIACVSQHPTAHKPTVRRQTPTRACAVKRDSARQPTVFIAPPLPALAQVVILAQALMGPHSTQGLIALAGQRHVILSMVCTATAHSASAPQHPLLLAQKQTDLLPAQSLARVAAL